MKGYWVILGTEVTDNVAQAEYNRLWAPNRGKIPLTPQSDDSSAVAEGSTQYGVSDRRPVPNV